MHMSVEQASKKFLEQNKPGARQHLRLRWCLRTDGAEKTVDFWRTMSCDRSSVAPPALRLSVSFWKLEKTWSFRRQEP